MDKWNMVLVHRLMGCDSVKTIATPSQSRKPSFIQRVVIKQKETWNGDARITAVHRKIFRKALDRRNKHAHGR